MDEHVRIIVERHALLHEILERRAQELKPFFAFQGREAVWKEYREVLLLLAAIESIIKKEEVSEDVQADSSVA